MKTDYIPRELKPLKQWVVWQYDGERKTPKNWRTHGNAGVKWANTWGTLKEVTSTLQRYPKNYRGVGLVLTNGDPYVCIDLDDCFLEGELTTFAYEVVSKLQGYVEFSPSGKGLHIWIKSPEFDQNYKRKEIEVYSCDRWITFTGKPYKDFDLARIPERSQNLAWLVKHINFTSEKTQESRRGNFAPNKVYQPIGSDSELWKRLFSSKNGRVFEALYNGDISVCYNDHSKAVIFLGNQLAVMTNFDVDAVKRLMYQTGLVTEKWETRRGDSTWIDYQIADCINYMRGKCYKQGRFLN